MQQAPEHWVSGAGEARAGLQGGMCRAAGHSVVAHAAGLGDESPCKSANMLTAVAFG